MMDNNPMPSLNENSDIFFPNNPMNESDSISSFKSSKVSEQVKAKIFIIEKIRRKRKARKYNADNIRKKIMRSFYRNLRMKLNKINEKHSTYSVECLFQNPNYSLNSI